MTQRGMADRPGCWWCRRPIRRPPDLSPAIPVVHCGRPKCADLERVYARNLTEQIKAERLRGMEPQGEA